MSVLSLVVASDDRVTGRLVSWHPPRWVRLWRTLTTSPATVTVGALRPRKPAFVSSRLRSAIRLLVIDSNSSR